MSEDCGVTIMETIVKENVTLYPASPAGGGCRALARRWGCAEKATSPYPAFLLTIQN
jgi:hypothetical protein